MKKYFKSILFLILSLGCFTACEEHMEEEVEFVNWQETNDLAFKKILDEAHQNIAKAKAKYGEEWEDHCEWRTFRSYADAPESKGVATDSICVRIKNMGTGSGNPIFTDSVKINYVGRLIPSNSYPEGMVFDHTSRGSKPEDVFRPEYENPAILLASNTVEGFTTAIQQMHIGDRWMVYIPSQLGYGVNNSGPVPAFSMLIFDLQLKGYYRPGHSKDK